jgi:hypothetical protein
MKTGFKLVLLIAIGLLVSAIGHTQNARQIAEKASQAIEFEASEMAATLKIYDAQGRMRERQIANASKKFGTTTKSIIKFLAPADVKGTAMLVFDYEDKGDDMWIYLPALRKSRRIVSTEKGKSFMGSEFSNADMSRPNLGQFKHEVLGSASFNGKDCWKVESTCLSEEITDELGFSRKLAWIEKGTYLTAQVEFFGRDGKLLKTMSLNDYRQQANGKHFAFQMKMKNAQNNRHSTITVDQFQLGSALNESYFSVATLEKL